ncbi:hypothetical protein DFH06DRAFT_1340960 [Mycena polygramma]|nr:hypothetical protein DFH06DRAFT_1340960 [Mycena polygramma]
MDPASQLRLRIAELSSAIQAQKRVLEDLENDRLRAQRELNSICDPMERLPLEISSEIFMLCMTCLQINPYKLPPFLSICHLWRTIALSTPFLWTKIEILSRPAKHDSLIKLCNTWFSRARTLPLSLYLDGPLDHRIRNCLKEYGHQLQELAVRLTEPEDMKWMKGPFPSLKKLSLLSDESFVKSAELVEILRAAPQLLRYELLHNFTFTNRIWDGEPFTHTSLRDLRLGDPEDYANSGEEQRCGNTAFVLPYLTLPALERLDISELDIPPNAFMTFFTRSSPPLQSLRMVIEHLEYQTAIGYFRLMPGLVRLELLYSEVDMNGDPVPEDEDPFWTFLEALRTADNFLPNLRDLTLRAWYPEQTDYEHLINALTARHSSRHTPLRSFQFIFIGYHRDGPSPEQRPDEHIILALQEFVDAGMHVHIGPRSHNLVNSISPIQILQEVPESKRYTCTYFQGTKSRTVALVMN